MDDFKAAHSGAVQDFQQRPVAQADGLLDLAQRHDPLDFLGGEDVFGQAVAQPGQLDLRRRIVQDEILPRHPTEPHAQGNKPRVLAAEGQRLAVLFAIEEEIPLIAFEHRARNLDGFLQAVLIGPFDEEAKIDAAAVDGVLGVAAHTERGQVLVHQQFHRRPWRGWLFAGFGYAGHALPSILPLPLGRGIGTTTTGGFGAPLASAPLYAFFALLSEKTASTRVIVGDSSS